MLTTSHSYASLVTSLLSPLENGHDSSTSLDLLTSSIPINQSINQSIKINHN